MLECLALLARQLLAAQAQEAAQLRELVGRRGGELAGVGADERVVADSVLFAAGFVVPHVTCEHQCFCTRVELEQGAQSRRVGVLEPQWYAIRSL